ncbi:hypothetical protein [Stutzerimonas nitrititolerans]|uniref:hypothetical protein n=1 Tax=Stutzerimonas nitrititolerans TaxID=2482751 RepID=UPI00289A5727|nr:hypothetical protein [Stutzerimonas nitrititolerans]
MPRPSALELRRNRLARLKASLDECGYRLVDGLDVEDPHTKILRANALAHRLALGQLIARGGEEKARLTKELAQLPELSAVYAFQEPDEVPLRVGKIAKTDEQLYSELVTEFSQALAELNGIEAEQDEELSTPDSISALADTAPKVGRPAKTPLENLDRGLSENWGTARLALAKAMINADSPRTMGRPARTVEAVKADYDARKEKIDRTILEHESMLRGVEIHDRAVKVYRDVLVQFKRLAKEVGGPDQISAKSEVARLEAHLKFLKADRKRYVEAGEPDLMWSHHNSPRFHLLNAKTDLAAVRDLYDELMLPRDIKRLKDTEEAQRKAKPKK